MGKKPVQIANTKMVLRVWRRMEATDPRKVWVASEFFKGNIQKIRNALKCLIAMNLVEEVEAVYQLANGRYKSRKGVKGYRLKN